MLIKGDGKRRSLFDLVAIIDCLDAIGYQRFEVVIK